VEARAGCVCECDGSQGRVDDCLVYVSMVFVDQCGALRLGWLWWVIVVMIVCVIVCCAGVVSNKALRRKGGGRYAPAFSISPQKSSPAVPAFRGSAACFSRLT
jgi:hypothetical protein